MRKAITTRTRDVLAGHRGQPLVSQVGGGAKYVGRVVVELWEEPDSTDARMLAWLVDPVDGDEAGLLGRVAAALPTWVAALGTA